MAFNYPPQQQGQLQNFYNQATQPQQQNVQPLFPQPQGNVYTINSTLEVANVPVGAGISIALCLNEGIMYIKTMQNGNPLFWAYKVEPYENNKAAAPQNEEIKEDFQTQIDERFGKIEEQIEQIKKEVKKKGEWVV